MTEQKTILWIYSGLCVSLLAGFVPHTVFAGVSALIFLFVFIAAYVVRAGVEKNSLSENHMTYIIRTLWISSLLALITVALASAYILPVYDPTPIHRCVDTIMSMSAPEENMIEGCLQEFMGVNRNVFIIGTAIAVAPLVLYIAYRLAKGLSRALKGYRIANEKSWL